MKMKRGVVAQLIYMLVLIAIAVVVGLFFMNIVEKNKKNAASTSVGELQIEAVKDVADNTIIIKTPQDPRDLTLKISVGGAVVSITKDNMTYNGFYYSYDTGST